MSYETANTAAINKQIDKYLSGRLNICPECKYIKPDKKRLLRCPNCGRNLRE